MNDPRSSNDPDLKAALKAWDHASPYRDAVFEDAMQIRTALRDTTSHQAYGWAALTCGRIAAHRQHVDLAEVLLTEALGRFYFVGDIYGEYMATSHLALPHIFRRNLNRALELAVRPFSSDIIFSEQDKFLLHNIAANCYWAREEPHPAIIHLTKAYDIVKNTEDFVRKSTVVGNIGATLERLGEWELALSASTEAWQLQLDNCTDPKELQLSHLGNMVFANCRLERYKIALSQAELLLEYLTPISDPCSWGLFDSLSEAFVMNGQIEKAQYCLDRSSVLKRNILTPYSVARTKIGEARLLEARKDYRSAIARANEVLNQSATNVEHVMQWSAALVLSRSYAALGRKGESAKWKKFATETGRERLLGNFLSNQIRASLKIEQPVEPLTCQELTCLSLSAHGQTSADIALKLDIKTRTVNFHFTNILRKLNAMNRQEAIAKAVGANLLH